MSGNSWLGVFGIALLGIAAFVGFGLASGHDLEGETWVVAEMATPALHELSGTSSCLHLTIREPVSLCLPFGAVGRVGN